MSREEAIKAHTVGPTARASGVPDCDLRLRHPTYQALDFEQVTRTEGDNFARIMVRFQEVFQSIDLIRRCIETLPEGPIRGGGFCKAGETSYSGEAPRGELTYYVKTDEYGRVVDIAIRTPSIMNIEACAPLDDQGCHVDRRCDVDVHQQRPLCRVQREVRQRLCVRSSTTYESFSGLSG